ncbi:unnamed protein product [Rotaria sp. Silwood1]|nr:unnamed protein product [Rotaria sp. Silwood1]CAF1275431.1 unnamed protein product [Rotaria sp. Silwood1]CAF3493714.1 unnamed protein product [Rotaria sp. Silwood1]CAF4937468.1 unnamed protein product [Rotaria sp. Silwood1]
MNNWFYMDRITFENLLNDELGPKLTKKLLLLDFDLAISFMIGETSNEILTKIQQTFSRKICRKIICDEHCILCSFNPSTYAKLSWFVQRLLVMSPLSKPFIKQISLSNEDSSYIQDKNITNDYNSIEKNLSNININKNIRNISIENSNNNCSECEKLTIIILFILFIFGFIIFHAIFIY